MTTLIDNQSTIITNSWWWLRLGTDGDTKTDEFSEKFQTAFDPPPSFLENHIADFATKLRQKCVCSLWRDCCVLYDPISHEMHVVQQFNVVIGWKHTLKRPFCIIFMLKKPYLKVQICPLWNFSENSSVLVSPSIPKEENRPSLSLVLWQI